MNEVLYIISIEIRCLLFLKMLSTKEGSQFLIRHPVYFCFIVQPIGFGNYWSPTLHCILNYNRTTYNNCSSRNWNLFQNFNQSELNGNGNGVADFNGKENGTFQKVPSVPLSVYSGDNQVSSTPDLYSGYTPTLPYPPPPPPHTANGGLNITNPRYSAMYRNTWLRYSPTEGHQSPGQVGGNSPYNTIRSQHLQQQLQQQQQYIQVVEHVQWPSMYLRDCVGSGRSWSGTTRYTCMTVAQPGRRQGGDRLTSRTDTEMCLHYTVHSGLHGGAA